MKTSIILSLFIVFILSSCTITGITNDYKKLKEEEKEIIIYNTDFKNLSSKKIYEINAIKLKEELQKNEKSLVYHFTNGCKSEICLPMITYERYAEENGYKLYLLMNGYGNLNKTLVQKFDSPLFSVDYKYYDTKYSMKANRIFINDLLGRDSKYKEKEYKGNLYFFEKDKLVKVSRELEL